MHVAFNLNPDSASGVDGLTAFFFQHCQDIVGNDIYNTLVELFKCTQLLESFHHNYIFMIPKKESPSRLKDFRPIILGNVPYKIFSKILTSRLSKTLSTTISKEHTIFLGRQKHYKEHWASSGINAMHREGFLWRNIILKLEIEKTFARIEWTFLVQVLETLASLLNSFPLYITVFLQKPLPSILRCSHGLLYFFKRFEAG